MSTIAIVGAGSGLGQSIAHRFGREGHDVALISRNAAKLEPLVADLREAGIKAHAFPADVTDRPALQSAFADIKARYGGVDVLEYSPAPHDPADSSALGPVDALELTVESVEPQMDLYLYGALTAVHEVLPEMRERRSGALLFATGASSGPVVHPPFGNIAAASAALRNWVLNLHEALKPDGVYAAHVAIATWIGKGGPETQPETIAEVFWELHSTREESEHLYSTL